MGWMKKRDASEGAMKRHIYLSHSIEVWNLDIFRWYAAVDFQSVRDKKGTKRIFPSKREAELEAFELVRGLENL